MNCPHCQTTLLMSERQGIEIDYCPDCRGVWLDRGELDKIIERNSSEAAAAALPAAPPAPLPSYRPDDRRSDEGRSDDRDDRDRNDRDRDDRGSTWSQMLPSGSSKKKKKSKSFLEDIFEF